MCSLIRKNIQSTYVIQLHFFQIEKLEKSNAMWAKYLKELHSPKPAKVKPEIDESEPEAAPESELIRFDEGSESEHSNVVNEQVLNDQVQKVDDTVELNKVLDDDSNPDVEELEPEVEAGSNNEASADTKGDDEKLPVTTS